MYGISTLGTVVLSWSLAVTALQSVVIALLIWKSHIYILFYGSGDYSQKLLTDDVEKLTEGTFSILHPSSLHFLSPDQFLLFVGQDAPRLPSPFALLSQTDISLAKGGHASFGRLLKLATPEIPLLLVALVGLLIGSASSLAMPAFFGRIMESLFNPDHGNYTFLPTLRLILCRESA